MTEWFCRTYTLYQDQIIQQAKSGSHGRLNTCTAFVLGQLVRFHLSQHPPYSFLHRCLHSSSFMRGNFVLKLVPNFGDGYGIIKVILLPPSVAFTQPTLTTYTLHHIDWVKGTHTTGTYQHVHVVIQVRHHYQVY